MPSTFFLSRVWLHRSRLSPKGLLRAQLFRPGIATLPGRRLSVVRRPMLQLLRRISLREYRLAPGRLILVLVGVASGVALIAALSIINASVLDNFRASLERAAGAASLQVFLGTGEIGFPDDALDTVTADRDVRAAFGLVRGYLAATDGSGDVLQLFGVDLTSDAINSYDVDVAVRERDDLVLLNDAHAVLLTTDYAARIGVGLGGTVSFATPTGVVSLRVRGLLEPHGLASVFGGDLAVMDLSAAQHLLGKARRLDQIDILVGSARVVAPLQSRLQAALPASLTVARPAMRGQRLERAIGAFQAMLDGLSLLCLLAGVFIVYNTMATAITHRARDMSVLLALGTPRGVVLGLVLTEAAVLGFVASGLGTAIGYELAHLLLQLVANSMGVIYQARFVVTDFVLTTGQVVGYLAIGTVSAVLAAFVPALKASRLDPLDLMRADFRERLAISAPRGRLVAVWAVMVGLTLCAVYLEEAHHSVAWGNVAASLWWVSGVIIAIPLMGWVSQVFADLLPRVFGLEGRLAAEGLTRAPGRTGITTAVIALSLTLAVVVSSVAQSFRESERDWFILVGDLVVSSLATEGGWLEAPLDPAVGTVLRTIPGVSAVETYRALQGQPFRDGRIAIAAVSDGFLRSTLFGSQIVDGSRDAAVAAVANGSGVIVSDNLADRFGLSVGDPVDVATPAGPHTWPVRGILRADYTGDQGSILVSWSQFVTLWGDPRVSHYNVFLAPGTPLEEVRAAIGRAVGTRYLVKVLTLPQTLAYHQHMVDRAFVFTYAIQLLVVAVTLAGILDLLSTEVIERRREIGTLRALGADVPQVVRAIMLEAGLIGMSGAMLGVALSIGTSLLWVRVNFRILIGYVLVHHFAGLTALWCIVLAAAVSLLAGWLAARTAVKYSVLDALRAE